MSRHVPDLPQFDDTVKPVRATAAPPKLDLPPPFRELSRSDSKGGAAAADDDFDAYDAIAVAALDVPSTDDHSDDENDVRENKREKKKKKKSLKECVLVPFVVAAGANNGFHQIDRCDKR
jgi:hypothetical protein